MPTLVTVSQPANNEILVSSAYLQGLGATSRLGESQIEHTTLTNSLSGDIFFKFYTCNDSTGSKVYSTLDVSSAISDATIENRFLALLFSQYSNDAAFVADVGGAMVDIAERVTGSGSLTNNLNPSLTMPTAASNPNYLEFVDMGLSSYFGATYVNGDNNTANTQASLRGTRVGQVHVTDVDPLSSPVNAKYDNANSGCWQFSDYNTEGIIVYTNLFGTGGAFANKGLSVWSQLLCVYPILADIYDARYACIFSDLDSSFLRSGLGFFDRNARATGNPNFYGWSGNFLLSIFNDWGIPLVSPIWSVSRIAMCAFLSTSGIRSSANFSGNMESSNKDFRWVGPTATQNVTYDVTYPADTFEKNGRSTTCLLYANECQLGSSNQCENLFGLSRQALGYANNAAYLAAVTATTTEGYNAHIYRYVLESSFSTNTPTNTRTMVTNGISWSGKLASQPSLLNCFTTTINNAFVVRFGTYYQAANSDFYGSTGVLYGAELNTRLEQLTTTSPPVQGLLPLAAAQVTLLTSWLYTP